jgi:hypothetical protein
MAATSQFKDRFEDYHGFVDKFKPKLTTDDCFTPPEVYDAVLKWAVKRYNLGQRLIIRPFWPGARYQEMEYPPGCVVVDNPPFSMITQIVTAYQTYGVDFFLFVPGLTLSAVPGTTRVITDAKITYANGTQVPTEFLTNLTPEIAAETAPDLGAALAEAQRSDKPVLSRYRYPANVVTAAKLRKLAAAGLAVTIPAAESEYVRMLDSQRGTGKNIFGGGLLVSDRLAAETDYLATLATPDTVVWGLSDREREKIAKLNSTV